MARIMECVPNISEGRDKALIEAVMDEVRRTEGVKLLDYSSDKDHNRTVITFVGTPEAVAEAAFLVAKRATELIDMRTHKGEHPRMGAVDVIPFIPISEVTVAEAIEISRQVGARIGQELNMSVVLYESSASAPHRENLADIRKGQYEKMKEKLKEPLWTPDFGPTDLNEKSGVVAVGARPPLVAFNINLATADVKIAKKIAEVIRFKTGGFRYVKAIGLSIEDRGITQVSMNLVNYEGTAIHHVFNAVEREAARYGVNVLESEVIGLLPMKALIDSAVHYLKINEDFTLQQILESRL
jgi:glutamate formiminotransferase